MGALPFDFPFFKETVAALVGVPSFAYTCYRYGRYVGSSGDKAIIQNLEAQVRTTEEQRNVLKTRFDGLQATVKDARDFWIRNPAQNVLHEHQQALHNSVPIITVVNFKGGVGKTTICSNLAAHFAEQGKRVLLIDCDYQGSLSDTALSHGRVGNFSATAQLLLEPGHDSVALRAAAERLSKINSNLWIYPAFYDFSRAEIQMMFRWLVGQEQEIRFNMADYLQSHAFKEDPSSRFDIVLIDCPPRLLTGAVTALTASTHVLVPTILDGASHIATLNTLSAIQQFQMKLNPKLRILGIVPSMVSVAGSYSANEQHFIAEIERQLPELYLGPVPVLKNYPILRRQELAKAGGSEILVAADGNNANIRQAREMFGALAGYISTSVQWRRPDGQDGPIIAMPGRENRRVAS